MRAFVDRHSITFPSVVDRPGAIFAEFGVPYQPAWVFIDAAGTATRFQGSLAEDELRERLDTLIE